jgi:hypothetical protein
MRATRSYRLSRGLVATPALSLPLLLPLLAVVAVVALVGEIPSGPLVGAATSPLAPPAAAQAPPGSQHRDGLAFVPADAAFFLHADFARIWEGPVLKRVREAAASTVDALAAELKERFRLAPDDIRSVTFFVPNLKEPGDDDAWGLILALKKPFDAAVIRESARKLLPSFPPDAIRAQAVDERTALLLVNLRPEKFGTPRPADPTGPLSDALREAAGGKHLVVIGVNPARLPEELRGDDLPVPFRPFAPLFQAQAVMATLGLDDQKLRFDLGVKTATAGQAVDGEKALGALLTLARDEVAGIHKQLEPAAPTDAALKDLLAVLQAVGDAMRAAKFTTRGNETRLTVSLPVALPYGGAFVAGYKRVREAADSFTSLNNLKQIAVALHNYADLTATMPPAAICDKTGKPLLSWRVAILEHIGQGELYKQFRLDEPWDSEHNRKLIDKMPRVYAIPGLGKPGETYYRVFVGNGAGFDWVRGARFPADFPDGTSNTLLCVTAAEPVIWTKPDELEFDPQKDPTKLLGRVVNGRCQMCFFDGFVRSFDKLPSRETLKALITRAGGEVIDEDF